MRCYTHRGVTGMSVLDRSQYRLTPTTDQKPSRDWREATGEARISNKDCWGGDDVTSWQAVALFDVGALPVEWGAGWGLRRYPHSAGHRSEVSEKGKRAFNEHRSRRMSWSVSAAVWFTPLVSFSAWASALSRNRSARCWPECWVKKKNQQRSIGGLFEEGHEFLDNKDVSEEPVIRTEELPELQTHLQTQTITPLSQKPYGEAPWLNACVCV